MNIKTKITFEYTDPKYAKIAYESLYPDNEGFVESFVDNNKLICIIENKNINTVLNTIDDLIQCEKIIETTSEII
ncbi:MAG: hypothetical protein IJJ47_03990 [Methanosphaera sp.]|nr:hypothetical protein [Methanosphaera sp.]